MSDFLSRTADRAANAAQRWTGARNSTRAQSEEDAGMAYKRLPVFSTREGAREALLTMIAWEIIYMRDNEYCRARLATILAELMVNPTHDQAEFEGLRFAIWPF